MLELEGVAIGGVSGACRAAHLPVALESAVHNLVLRDFSYKLRN